MEKLTVTQEQQKSQLVRDLREKSAIVEKVITDYNKVMEEQKCKVIEAISQLNTVITEADEFREDVRDQLEEYFNSMSEKWQESENGKSYTEWLLSWETRFYIVEEIEFNEVDTHIDDLADEIEDLPSKFYKSD